MSITDRDYILRMIQRVAQALAAIVARRTEGKTDEALALLERARVETFGPMRDALDAVDATSVASLLGEMEKARTYATFCAVEADLRADRGEDRAATRARRRALAVYREAAARFPREVTDADREAMAKLET